jgi:hypothetical protein
MWWLVLSGSSRQASAIERTPEVPPIAPPSTAPPIALTALYVGQGIERLPDVDSRIRSEILEVALQGVLHRRIPLYLRVVRRQLVLHHRNFPLILGVNILELLYGPCGQPSKGAQTEQ